MTQKRDRLEAALREQRERRVAAQISEREALDAIAALLPRALDAGISKREIARLAGVGRPWIDKAIGRSDSNEARPP